MEKQQKRYQFWGRNGKEWTPWFDFNGTKEPIQLKGHKGNNLLNEYKTITV